MDNFKIWLYVTLAFSVVVSVSQLSILYSMSLAFHRIAEAIQ